MNKKSIALSVNFLVTIILALVIFGFGVVFIADLVNNSKELVDDALSDVDQELLNAKCDSMERICLGLSRLTIPRNEFRSAPIRIVNILDSQEFRLTVTATVPPGFSAMGTPLPTSDIEVLYTSTRFMEKFAEADIPLGFQVPSDTTPGTYIFDVTVHPYDDLEKIYIEVE